MCLLCVWLNIKTFVDERVSEGSVVKKLEKGCRVCMQSNRCAPIVKICISSRGNNLIRKLVELRSVDGEYKKPNEVNTCACCLA